VLANPARNGAWIIDPFRTFFRIRGHQRAPHFTGTCGA
jgi:hypothetical protein